MARKASSKPESVSSSAATFGFEAALVDIALRDSAFPQSEATSQVLSKAKNNMVALPGQLFYSTQIPVCFWFSGKTEPADKSRAVSELEPALAA